MPVWMKVQYSKVLTCEKMKAFNDVETTFSKKGKVYTTKCGHKFRKNTNAQTTGFRYKESQCDENFLGCSSCLFPNTRETYVYNGANEIFYECRSASERLNFKTEWHTQGMFDTTKIMIKSMDVKLMDSVIQYAEETDNIMYGSYHQDDEADGRRAMGVHFDKNRKGLMAKVTFLKTFFSKDSEVRQYQTLGELLEKHKYYTDGTDHKKYLERLVEDITITQDNMLREVKTIHVLGLKKGFVLRELQKHQKKVRKADYELFRG